MDASLGSGEHHFIGKTISVIAFEKVGQSLYLLLKKDSRTNPALSDHPGVAFKIEPQVNASHSPHFSG